MLEYLSHLGISVARTIIFSVLLTLLALYFLQQKILFVYIFQVFLSFEFRKLSHTLLTSSHDIHHTSFLFNVYPHPFMIHTCQALIHKGCSKINFLLNGIEMKIREKKRLYRKLTHITALLFHTITTQAQAPVVAWRHLVVCSQLFWCPPCTELVVTQHGCDSSR